MKTSSSYSGLSTRVWVKVLAGICIANAVLLTGVDAACVDLVSGGDKGVGISAFDDASCVNGGIGCFQIVCRYCKTRESVQASQFVSCPGSTTAAPAQTTAAPVATTVAPKPATAAPVTSAPVVAPVGACADMVPGGDKNVGISAVSDLSCKNGGLGCFAGGTCRYCKTKDTIQAGHFLACSNFAPATSAPVTTTPPVTLAPVTLAPVTSAPVTSAPVSLAPATSAPATSAPSTFAPAGACADMVPGGDKNVGISAVSDLSCKNGGLGCFAGGTCRYCKTKDTIQAGHFLACTNFAPATSAPVTTTPPVTLAPVTSVPVTSAPVTSAPVTLAPTTSAPLTQPPATVTPPPTAPVGVCADKVPLGDKIVGISAVSDLTCKSGGVGCFADGTCRYCKTKDTIQAGHFLACSNFAPAVTVSPAPAPEPATTVPATPVTTAPVTPATVAPGTSTPAPATVAPQTAAPATIAPVPDQPSTGGITCPDKASPGDLQNGIKVITDLSCVYNPVAGCYKDICRFCKTKDTPGSANFLPCPETVAPATPTPQPTTAPPTGAPAPGSLSPVALTPAPVSSVTPFPIPTPYTGKMCTVVVSLGDSLVGIKAITDPGCQTEAKVGCFESVCRYCKTKSTIQSNHLLDCPVDAIPSGPLIPQACKRTVSLGDTLQGIAVVTDFSCSLDPGVGCADNYCRFCKTKDTPASAHLRQCCDFPTIPTSVKTPAANICSSAIQPSQAMSGIWTNVLCSEWYHGQCLKSTCPLCKFYDTTESSGLPVCVAPPTAPVVPPPMPGAPAANLCTDAVLEEVQPSYGIWAMWDQTCTNSQSDCVSKCRYCKYGESAQSAAFKPCGSIHVLPPAPVYVPPPAGSVRPPTPNANQCSGSMTQQDVANGVWRNAQCYETDAVGACVSVVCSPCSFFGTEASFKFPDCVNGITPYWSSSSPAVNLQLAFNSGDSQSVSAVRKLSVFEVALGVAAVVGVVALLVVAVYGARRTLKRTMNAAAAGAPSGAPTTPSILAIVTGDEPDEQPQVRTARPRKVKAPRTPVTA